MEHIEHSQMAHEADTEKKHSEKIVTVFYKHEPYELERRLYSYEELVDVFKVPAGYKLDLIENSGKFRELKPGDSLRIKKGIEFTSHAPCGQSS